MNELPTSAAPEPKCPSCGGVLPVDAPLGLCPRCLMAEALREEEAPNDAIDPTATPLGGFGSYDLLEEIGHGGMGVVYKASQRSLNRVVALKMLLGGQFAGKVALGRFRAEAELAAQLQHPNIVAIHEVGEQDGLPYFTMDFVQGRNLADLARDQPLPPQTAATYLQTIAEAIHYAHGQGVLHRDLKPSNILIDAFDQPRITDFGLAKRFTGSTSDLTISGQALGSPNFMPPEQAAGKHGSSAPTSDIYGLGAILYYLLTARPPFMADNVSAAVRQVLEQEPVSPRTLNPGVPRDLETICLKCLQKDPAQRYATAHELAEELGRFRRGEPIRARPVSAATQFLRWCRRKPVLAGLGGVVLALAAVSTTVAIRMTIALEGQEQERYRANIQLATSRIRDGSTEEALETLLKCPERLRHWEWGFLVGECHREALALEDAYDPLIAWNGIAGQDHDIPWRCGFSPDGQRVAAIHPGGLVQVWELPSGKPVWRHQETNEPLAGLLWLPDWTGLVRASSNKVEIVPAGRDGPRLPLEGHAARIRRLAVSPTGDRVAALAADDTVRIWEAANGSLFARFPVIPNGQRLFFTGDGRRLVVAAALEASAYDSATGAVRTQMAGDGDATVAVMPDSEAERFLTVSRRNHYRLWSTNGLIRDLGEVSQVHFQEAAFSPDRQLFCTSGYDNTAYLCDSRSGNTLMMMPSRVDNMAFSVNAERLATWSRTPVIEIWDVVSRRPLLKLQGHREGVHDVAFSPDGRRVVSVSAGGSVKVWSASPGREIIDVSGLPWGVAHTGDGRHVANATLPDGIMIRDTESGRTEARFQRLHRNVVDLAFRPGDRELAAGDVHGAIAIWEVATGRVLHVLRGHRNGVTGVRYSPDGRRLVTGSTDGTARLWDADSGKPLHVMKQSSGAVWTVDFSPDGQHVAAAGDDSGGIWKVETGQRECELRDFGGPVWWGRYTPDGTRLAATCTDNYFRIWDARTGRLVDRWNLRGISMRFALSPDGRRAAFRVAQGNNYAGDTPTMEIWDFETGRQIFALRGNIEISSLSGFSPDGRRLVTDWWDAKVRQWEAFPWVDAAYPGSPAQLLRARIRLYADQYWKERLAAETRIADTNGLLEVKVPFDRSQIPARDPRATRNLLDLTAHYTNPMDECSYIAGIDYLQGINLGFAPRGLVTLQGVPFDLRGIIQLTQNNPIAGLWEGFPESEEGIKVGQRFGRLHAVVGSVGGATEGHAIGAVVLHYADGSRHECLVLYGRHVRDWWTDGDPRADTDLAQLAWEGPHAFPHFQPTRLRIYHAAWDNPRPNEEVLSLDFVSRMSPTAAPFLVAVTVE